MIDQLFAWIIDDDTGTHGILAVMVNGFPMQAVSSRRDLMETATFRTAARNAALVTGCTVELKRFILAGSS
jgi:hypothetical protein